MVLFQLLRTCSEPNLNQLFDAEDEASSSSPSVRPRHEVRSSLSVGVICREDEDGEEEEEEEDEEEPDKKVSDITRSSDFLCLFPIPSIVNDTFLYLV